MLKEFTFIVKREVEFSCDSDTEAKIVNFSFKRITAQNKGMVRA